MTSRWRYLLLAVLGVAVMVPAAVAGIEVNPSIEAVNEKGGGLYSEEHHRWSPSQRTVAVGGTVTLSNSSEIPHGVRWVSDPATPVCEEGAGKVPVGTTAASSGTKWSGKCTFSQAGTYTFYCTVHGPEMTGTITVEIPEAPLATTEAAGEVGQTEATLNGTVNPEGKATEYFFEWGTTAGYGNTTSKLPLGSVDHAAHAVSVKVTGLAPGAPYHFRLVAKNEAATTPGADRSFFTVSASPPPHEEQPPPREEQPPPHEEQPAPHEQPPSTPITTTTQSPGATTPTPSVTPNAEALNAPLVALGSSARSAQHGGTVTGALEVSAAGAGGRLEIDLLAKGSSLGKGGRSAAVRVGRLLRGSVSAGRVPFAVKLDAAARRALKRLRRLAVTVRVTLTPAHGRARTITYGVQLRG